MTSISAATLSLACAGSGLALDRLAASLDRDVVMAKYAECVSGVDRLILPPGDKEWFACGLFTKDVDIIGAGIGQTIIRDSIDYRTDGTGAISNSNWDRAVFVLAPPTGSTVRVSGIEIPHGTNLIIDGNLASAYAVGAIQTEPGTFNGTQFVGSNATFIFDNIKTSNLRRRAFYFWGGSRGVMSNCEMTLNSGVQAIVFYTNLLYNDIMGDGSFENPPAYGTGTDGWWFYVEDCKVNGAEGDNMLNMTDGFAGAKFVVRGCTISEIGVGVHGTESTNRYRGARALEVYHNVFRNDLDGNDYATIELRSGCGKFFNNRSLNGWSYDMVLTNYRNWGAFPPWGGADGTHLWDNNDTSDLGTVHDNTPAGDGIFCAGTADTTHSLDWDDTEGITISQAVGSATVTASAPIFTSSMVGKHIFVATSGRYLNNRRITSFTNSTNVVTSTDLTSSYAAVSDVNSSNRFFTDCRFVIGDDNALRDSTKSWTPDQWIGYMLREYTPTLTVTSVAAPRNVTVSGETWGTNQWFYWTATSLTSGRKWTVHSNTADTLSFSGNGPINSMIVGEQFYLSRSSEIDDNTSDTLYTQGQGATQSDYLTYAGMTYEIRKVLYSLDQPGRGQTDNIVQLIPTSSISIHHQNLNQQLDPVYSWGNYKDSTRWTANIAQRTIQANRELFLEQANIHGSAGTMVGTAATKNSTVPTGAGSAFWVTDEGAWNQTFSGTIAATAIEAGYLCEIVSTGTSNFTTIGAYANTVGQTFKATGVGTGTGTVKPAQGRLYVWDGDSWNLDYTPYTYPHPLRQDVGPDVIDPTIQTAAINGATITIGLSEACTGGAAGQFALSSGSLSGYSIDGATITMTRTPAAAFGDPPLTIDFTPGTIEDAAGNPLGAVNDFPITNNTPDGGGGPPPSVRNPGRVRGKPRLVR